MKILKNNILAIVTAMMPVVAVVPTSASEITDGLLQEYKQIATEAFNSDRGEKLWFQEVNGHSCTSCHSPSVKTAGTHENTGKTIQPMAPSVNPERLTDRKKIEKWFLRNCKSTFGRECTAQEKGDILLWLSQQ